MKTILKIARLRFLTVCLASVLVLLAGCGGGGQSEEKGSAGNAADAPPAPEKNLPQGGDQALGKATLAGVSFMPPPSWKDL